MFFLESAFTIIGIGLVLFAFKAISAKSKFAGLSLLKRGDSRIPRIDFEGCMLLVLAVTVPLLSVTLGGNFIDWASPAEVVLLACSPLFVCLFVLYEAKIARVPIVDMRPVFRVRYLQVLFQVFGVIMILNCVRPSSLPSIHTSDQIDRSFSSSPHTHKSDLPSNRHSKNGP